MCWSSVMWVFYDVISCFDQPGLTMSRRQTKGQVRSRWVVVSCVLSTSVEVTFWTAFVREGEPHPTMMVPIVGLEETVMIDFHVVVRMIVI